VLATQNPIELEGTYPLPEAQLDRFLFNSILDYLTADDEVKVLDLTTNVAVAQAETVTNANEILEYQKLIRMTPISEAVARYAVEFVRGTRPNASDAPDFVKKYVNFGASVRATQYLVLASKARALINGRFHVASEDIRALAAPVLRHRILLNFHAESERISTDEIVRRLLEFKTGPRA
jgi:MoxR-like ATPase